MNNNNPHKGFNLSSEDVQKLHDLIVKIQINSTKLEDDIRNLNNLFHFLKGDGFRFKEYEGKL